MKTQNSIENWDLIAKYFANECNQEEENELFEWINQNPGNKELFNQVKQDIEILKISKSMNKVNVDKAWVKVRNRIQEEDENLPLVEEYNTRVIRFSSVLKYAAMVIVLLGIGILSNKIYQNISNKDISLVYAANNEQGKEIVLPDGSIVVLNSESTISYPNTFAGNERRVVLKGEAFFDVTKNQDKPFIIESKNAEVKVLGTSFNVNANLPDNQVEVFVKTGLVQLSDTRDVNKKILIKPGDVGLINNMDLSKSFNKDLNRISWKTKEIIFHEDNLSNVIQTLNKVYNINISCIDQNILDLPYTATFRDQEIDSVLNVICMTFDLKIDYSDDQINLMKHSN